MTKPWTNVMIAGLFFFVAAGPALAQFNPGERMREEQEQKRGIGQPKVLPQDNMDLFDWDGPEGDPLFADAKPVVSPWAGRPREDVVAGLDDEAFSVRESAQAFLLADDTLTSETLHEWIKAAQSPEQRRRLMQVAKHHTLREWRSLHFGEGTLAFRRSSAAIGFSMETIIASDNPYRPVPGVRIAATMPGFPGYAHLRRGDIIVQIDGYALPVDSRVSRIEGWVPQEMGLRDPGERVELIVLRGGELLRFEMRCAEKEALNEMYATGRATALKGDYEKDWQDAEDAFAAERPAPKRLTPTVLAPAP